MISDELLTKLKSQKIILASWNVSNPAFYQNRDWIPLLRELFDQVIVFSPRDFFIKYGKEKLNREIIDLVMREKPNYILFSISYDEFFPKTLAKIKEISPETKLINFFGDDNWRYDDWSRYFAPFFDYIWISEGDKSIYSKDGISEKKVFFVHGVNTSVFYPRNMNKKYDVTFIGMPIRDRYDYIKFLMENRVNLKLFGPGWENYPDLKNIYGGFLSSEEYVNVINQSKINLNFSKTRLQEKNNNDTHTKGRVLEINACKSFLLTENFSRLEKFFQNKHARTPVFKNKKELLEKINYYLQNEIEREKIAEEFYNEVKKKYLWRNEFLSFFKKVNSNRKTFKIPKIKGKALCLPFTKVFLPLSVLKEKLLGYDYVYFSDSSSREREFFQSYSLEKSKKNISCCDYYLFSNLNGDYALFKAKQSFKELKKASFRNALNVNQFMFKKDFFLKNLNEIRNFSVFKRFFLNEENIVFVSIPMTRVKDPPILSFSEFEKSFAIRVKTRDPKSVFVATNYFLIRYFLKFFYINIKRILKRFF